MGTKKQPEKKAFVQIFIMLENIKIRGELWTKYCMWFRFCSDFMHFKMSRKYQVSAKYHL